ncbi:MAG: flagellar basal body rod protein FlgB [Fimbriimonadaceae bacterium]
MEILNNLFGPHIGNLSNALGRTTQRHALLSNNLANVNTPGYKRQDMGFGITLDGAMQSKSEQFRSGSDDIKTDENSVLVDGNSVDLEKEVTKLAETELRYQALTDMTAQYFSGLKNVIKEGR